MHPRRSPCTRGRCLQTLLLAGLGGVLPACSDGSAVAEGPLAMPTAIMTPADSPVGDQSETTPAGSEMRDPFTLQVLDDVRLSSHSEDEFFQRASGSLDWGQGPFQSVVLKVQLDTTCYPFEKWRTTPPPEGHNFPEMCDAFDRNFDINIQPEGAAEEEPAFEVVHAITPFGGPMSLTKDLTDLANGRPGAHTLEAYIATWSDGAGQVTGAHGGWNVTVTVDVTPGPAPREVLAAIPLLNQGLGHMETLSDLPFDLPGGTNSMVLEYRTSGHGGGNDPSCFGPADEFCQRQHHLYLDSDTPFTDLVPYRNDCADFCTLDTSPTLGGQSFCRENPNGLPASVRAPRSNWCPGDETIPFSWHMNVHGAPSSHRFKVAVDDIAEGGSWHVSATVYALAQSAE